MDRLVGGAREHRTHLLGLAAHHAAQVGGRVVDLRSAGKPVPAWLLALRWLAEVAVFRNVKTSLGLQRARTLISAAAPISAELLRWYVVMGLEIVEGYGLTEAPVLTMADVSDAEFATGDRLLVHRDRVLVDEDRVLVRGLRRELPSRARFQRDLRSEKGGGGPYG